jgi:hypothetical protein
MQTPSSWRRGRGRLRINTKLYFLPCGEEEVCGENPITVMGVRGTGTAEVEFHDCEVGEEAVVGGVSGGFKVMLNDLNNGRMCVGAIGFGIAQGAMKEAEIYA